MMRYLAIFIALFLVSAKARSEALMATKQAPAGVRRTVWTFGLTGQRNDFRSGSGDELIGNSGMVQLGTGYVGDAWYADASLDILLGPYEPTRGKQLDVDFFGTGITIWSGFSAQGQNLRSTAGGYGFAMGLSYADMVGRSIGRNHKDSGTNSPEDQKLIDHYTMRVTNLSLLPAIFFSWLSEARPSGNTPDLLMTRLEGYILTLGATMPLIANYSTKYSTRGDGSEQESTASEPASPPQSGRLLGYGIFISFKAMLGT